jgi:hypothetical protein
VFASYFGGFRGGDREGIVRLEILSFMVRCQVVLLVLMRGLFATHRRQPYIGG